MNKQFVMLSGLPRSGSTVLGSMLNQHPLIHSSTTSPVIDMIEVLNNTWPAISGALTNTSEHQYTNMIRGVCEGAYEHIQKPVIIDKNRLWPRHGKLMTAVLEHKPKIICTVRSIPEILSSYITLINKNPNKITFIDQDLIDNKLVVNNKNRCKILWEKYINGPYNGVRIGVNSPNVDLLVVTYADIVEDSQNTMNKICNFISVDSVDIDLQNMQQMNENDMYHGGITGLHDVRPTMKRVSLPPEMIIGNELTAMYTNMKLDFWNKR